MIWLKELSIDAKDQVVSISRGPHELKADPERGQYRCLLRVLVELQMDGRSSFGLTLKDLQERTGLPAEGVMTGLGLLEENKWLMHRVTQVGTAGPYDTFYRLDVEVLTAFVRRNAKKENV